MLGSFCFVVYSEQLAPRRFAVTSLEQEEWTQADKETFIALAQHVGDVITPVCVKNVLQVLNANQPWKFLQKVRSHAYFRVTKILDADKARKYGIDVIAFCFQKTIEYQVGTDRRLLVAYNIRKPWSEENVDALLSFNEPITFECDEYKIGMDKRLHVKVAKPQQAASVLFDYDKDFPKLKS